MNLALLKALCEAHGPPGRESAPREIIRAELRALGLDPREDALGNLIVHAGGGGDRPLLLLDAHMDEVALMASHIYPGGAVGFAALGGWDARNLPAQEVTIRTANKGFVGGVIGSKPPHISSAEERNRAWGMDALWVDLGSTSEEETRALGVEIGDTIVLNGDFRILESGVIRAKALDDRAGCFVILEALRVLCGGELPVRLAASFSVMEEVGTRGIRAVMAGIDCSAAIHLEATVAADVPGVAPMQCPSVFGKGPVISVIDNSIIVAERMVEHLEASARERGIPTQRKRPIFGGTNAGAAHLTGAGVLCGIISLPARYIHSPVSLIRQDDLQHAIELVIQAARGADRLFAATHDAKERPLP